MKWVTVVGLVALSGCTTTSTSMASRRIGLSTIPTAPLGFTGASGVGVGVRKLFAPPEPNPANGLGFPAFQIEGGGLARFRDGRTSLGGTLNFGFTAAGFDGPPGALSPSSEAFTVTGAVSVAHDVPFNPYVGLTVAGELGLSLLPVRSGGLFVDDKVYVLPGLTGGLSFFASLQRFRPWVGVTLGTGPISDADGVQSQRCDFGCSSSSDGRTTIGVLSMVSAGLSWRPLSGFSVAAEVLVPLTEVGARIPVSGGLSVRFADLDPKPPGAAPRIEDAPLPPPPPMPPPEPESQPVVLPP